MEFSDLKDLLLGRMLLSGIGGTPVPNLTQYHPVQKILAESRGT